ncbi:hypothetical protein MTsPCn5_34560 [Croceitalea sp. MTPC5]|uniref:DUF4249 domain-containing protein n=2 Tax=Flavobacteriales TaxID=200644 RepID=A0A223V6U1_9FLAO|nr:hypothetical protein CJ263_12220 [Maribacter cobaltidurans]GMN08067.1 hypothetical protein MTsPCn5_34560 [Croceitalea sp. MTPC5]
MSLKNIFKIENKIKIVSLLGLSIIIFSCTEAIDLSVPTESPRLVIEASIGWEKGTLGNNQTIKLSLTTPYYDTAPNPVAGASVRVENITNGDIFIFEDQQDGRYTTSDFEPMINNTYNLEVIYNNETYTAEETLMPVPEIDRIEQSRELGSDPEELDLTIYFNDPANEVNFYYITFLEGEDLLPTREIMSDEFTNGNEMSLLYEEDEADAEDEILPGDMVDINLYGISEEYYDFLHRLIEQSDNAGDPFATVPTRLRGNYKNLENPDNYAFGYFRITEFVNEVYTFVE